MMDELPSFKTVPLITAEVDVMDDAVFDWIAGADVGAVGIVTVTVFESVVPSAFEARIK